MTPPHLTSPHKASKPLPRKIPGIEDRSPFTGLPAESVFFAQPLNTNLLCVDSTFGMAFGECPLRNTFRLHTSQKEAPAGWLSPGGKINLTS